jgi:hypothetical protein
MDWPQVTDGFHSNSRQITKLPIHSGVRPQTWPNVSKPLKTQSRLNSMARDHAVRMRSRHLLTIV